MKKLLVLAALFGFLISSSAHPPKQVKVTLAWNPVTEAVSYNLYVLNQNQQTIEILHTTHTSLAVNLQTRTQYFFAATAVAANGLESFFSNEVEYYHQ